ncbi:MAG: hypothetical protein ACT4NL_07690 [Pseudomarimonas sp.]
MTKAARPMSGPSMRENRKDQQLVAFRQRGASPTDLRLRRWLSRIALVWVAMQCAVFTASAREKANDNVRLVVEERAEGTTVGIRNLRPIAMEMTERWRITFTSHTSVCWSVKASGSPAVSISLT